MKYGQDLNKGQPLNNTLLKDNYRLIDIQFHDQGCNSPRLKHFYRSSRLAFFQLKVRLEEKIVMIMVGESIVYRLKTPIKDFK